jgi:tetratricopeptide (TPR) repeat protein
MKSITFSLCFLISSILHAQKVDSIGVNLQVEIENATTRSEKITSKLKAAEYFLNSNLNRSEDYLNEVKTLITDKDVKYLGMLNEYLATVYRKKGNYSLATQYGLKSKSNFERISDTLGIARSLIDLGITGRYRDDNNQSIKYFQKAVILSKIKNDSSLISQSYNMMGIAYRRLSKPDSAMLSYQKAIRWIDGTKYANQKVSI